MNPNNSLYKHAKQLNEYGIKLVRQFLNSKQYSDLCFKINSIDKEIDQLNIEYKIKFRDLIKEKLNIQLHEIPNAKDEYVRKHIESYKMHLRTKEANSLFEDKGENLSVITTNAISDWSKSEFTDLNKCNDFINGVHPYAYDDPEREEILDNLQNDLINKYGCDKDEVYSSRSMIDMVLADAVQKILDKMYIV